jgi:hypothetical protein
MTRALRGPVAAALLTALLGGCATGGGYPVSVGDRTTLMYGWENHFGIQWTVDAPTADTRVVRGQVSALGPIGVDRMRVLVQASDAAGHPAAQQLVWISFSGTGGNYFEARLPAAEQYRVTVWDYTLIESIGNLF